MGYRRFCRERSIEGGLMGIICNIKDIERIWNLNNHYPVITALETEKIADKFKGFGYLSLGKCCHQPF